ncbi:MAG: alpha/beta hydrolase family protein [Clostridia bacterium]|nr:alpha/beta hydrolase family protein [Clostridia bacterium]
MALMQIRLRSGVLSTRTEVMVVLPIDNKGFNQWARNPKYQVVYMLHGGGGDASMWLRETSAERYARERNVALIFPDAGGFSYYTDCAYGKDYWTYISEELPEMMSAMLPISERREDRFVAGFSMGGYGAFKCALMHPEMFSAAAALSGGFDLERLLADGLSSVPNKSRMAIFGEPPKIDPNASDLYVMLKNLKEQNKEIPLLYTACGSEDHLTYACHTRMIDFCKKHDIPLEARTSPGGHTFKFWDPATEAMLDWLPLKREPLFD